MNDYKLTCDYCGMPLDKNSTYVEFDNPFTGDLLHYCSYICLHSDLDQILGNHIRDISQKPKNLPFKFLSVVPTGGLKVIGNYEESLDENHPWIDHGFAFAKNDDDEEPITNLWDLVINGGYNVVVDNKYIAGLDYSPNYPEKLSQDHEFMKQYSKDDFDINNLKAVTVDDFENELSILTKNHNHNE